MEKGKTVKMIIDKFFKDAEPHLLEPLETDLKTLDSDQLEFILGTESLPFHDDDFRLLSHLISSDFLTRLDKRAKMHRAIKEAKESDAFEAV